MEFKLLCKEQKFYFYDVVFFYYYFLGGGVGLFFLWFFPPVFPWDVIDAIPEKKKQRQKWHGSKAVELQARKKEMPVGQTQEV